jgi:hypothetical protein
LSKPPKITFRTPNLQTPIKPIGNIFDRRDPKKKHLIDHSLQNGILAYILRYFAIAVLYIII